MTVPMTREWLTAREVADYFGVSDRYVRMISDRLDSVKLPGHSGTRMFPRESVERYAERHYR